MTDLETAWNELRAALPPRWVVGRPSQHGPLDWVLYAFDPAERPKVDKRTREVEARAATELGVVLELARGLGGAARWSLAAVETLATSRLAAVGRSVAVQGAWTHADTRGGWYCRVHAPAYAVLLAICKEFTLMGFLKHLVGGSSSANELTVAEIDDQRQDAWLDIVGESNYQSTLERIGGGRKVEGVSARQQYAIVMPEPSTKYDRNAIAVHLRDGGAAMALVGYLSREDAVAYRPLFATIQPRVLIARAHLRGGWYRSRDDQGPIGVQLNLGSPAEVVVEVWCKDHGQPPTHPYTGKTVVFTDDGGFSLGTVHLDKRARAYLATKAGCIAATSVTKKTDIVVWGDYGRGTAKTVKATEYGIPVVDERQFWAEIGVR